MPSLRYASYLDASSEDVFDWHTRPGALHRLLPPWMRAEVRQHDGLSEGGRADLHLHAGPLRLRWHALHTEVVEGSRFTDRQEKGPFKQWIHEHRMEPDGGGCRLVDEIEYALPAASLLEPTLGPAIRRRIGRMFAYRHRTLGNDLHLHERYGAARLRVGITGSSGLIGEGLVHFLESGGHEVVRIVRERAQPSERTALWNYRDDALETDKLEGLDAVVHLAGENVLVPRWSEQKKMDILGSRVRGTDHLARRLAQLDQPPAVFLSASGIGYYGHRGDERLDESSPPGDDGFLSAVCQDWENAVSPAAEAGIRTVPMRIGIVLTSSGGILAPLLLPFQFGLGGCYGSAHQYLSWIGLDDTIAGIYHLIRSDVEGPVNLTAPNPVPLGTFVRCLGRVLSRPTAVNLPPTLIRAALGEVADEAALMSVRALPDRLSASGYEFLHPELETMLRHTLGRTLEPIADPDVHGTNTATAIA